jgi:hypothetical protein
MDVGSLAGSRGWGRTETQIKRETKGATDGRDAAYNIGPINGAAVPGICSSMSGFNKNGISATVVCSNGDGFVEEAVKMLHTNSVVVPTGGNMDFDVESGADSLEKTFEGTAVVNDD